MVLDLYIYLEYSTDGSCALTLFGDQTFMNL